jgi:hypothetical protein
MPMNDWSALTPALSPKRGSAATTPVVDNRVAAFVARAGAASSLRTRIGLNAPPLLGARVGVRAGVSSKQLGQRIIVQRFALAHAARFKL